MIVANNNNNNNYNNNNNNNNNNKMNNFIYYLCKIKIKKILIKKNKNRLLKTTIEDILPSEYYTNSMLGLKAEIDVLSDLLSQKLPKVAAHIHKFQISYYGLVSPWFLCLFINSLSFEVYFFISFFLFYFFFKIFLFIYLFLSSFLIMK